MGVLQRFERLLEVMVTGTFARIFRSAVQPVEIASALQRELDNSAQVLSRDASLVPNAFVVELSPSDHDRLAPYAATLSEELAEVVTRYARAENYAFTGPVSVTLERRPGLGTGRFRVRGDAVAAVTPSPPTRGPVAYGGAAARPGAAAGPAGSAAAGGTRPAGAGHGLGRGIPTPPVPDQPAPYLEVNGVRHVVVAPGLVLGRGTDADLRITDPGVSRRHAEIRVQAGPDGQVVVTLHDLGSTNGTVVNGRRADEVRLTDGAEILLGNTVAVFRQPADATGEAGPRPAAREPRWRPTGPPQRPDPGG